MASIAASFALKGEEVVQHAARSSQVALFLGSREGQPNTSPMYLLHNALRRSHPQIAERVDLTTRREGRASEQCVSLASVSLIVRCKSTLSKLIICFFIRKQVHDQLLLSVRICLCHFRF